MAKPGDISVVISDFSAKKADINVKLDKMSGIMSKAVEGVISKAKLDLKKGTTGLKSGYLVTGNLMTLKQDSRQGKTVVLAVVSLAVATLPKEYLVSGKIEGTAHTPMTDDLQGDAAFVVEAAAKEAAKEAVKQIERAAGK